MIYWINADSVAFLGRQRQAIGMWYFLQNSSRLQEYFRVPLGVSRITEVVIEVLNFLFLIGMVTVIF